MQVDSAESTQLFVGPRDVLPAQVRLAVTEHRLGRARRSTFGMWQYACRAAPVQPVGCRTFRSQLGQPEKVEWR